MVRGGRRESEAREAGREGGGHWERHGHEDVDEVDEDIG